MPFNIGSFFRPHIYMFRESHRLIKALIWDSADLVKPLMLSRVCWMTMEIHHI